MPLVEGYNTTNNKNMAAHISDDNRLKTTTAIESGASIEVSGNAMELFGASIATRPLATAVSIGTTFTVVADPIVVYMSDGTNWVEVA